MLHWTGRRVCLASTREWAIRRFLYNNTDATAVQAVGRVIGQRCLETGVCEVFLKTIKEGDSGQDSDRMREFVSAVRQSGLVIGEGRQYEQQNPHLGVFTWKGGIRPWEYTDS